jgi:glycosyltransferase involved in cell wall biosynthesis
LCFEHTQGFGGSIVSLARLIKHADPQRYLFHAVVSHPIHRDYLLSTCEPVTVVVDSARLFSSDAGVGRLLTRSLGRMGRIPRKAAFASIAGLNLAGPARSFARRVVAAHRAYKFDAVWLNNGAANSFGAGGMLAKRWKIPLVSKVQGFPDRSPTSRWFARKADLLLPDSQAVADRLLELGVEPNRITPTYCPVDDREFDPRSVSLNRERKSWGDRGDVLAFGIIGQLIDWKGQDVFLEAAKRVLAHHRNCVAVVVGDDPDRSGEWLAKLKHLAAKLGIGDRVRFVGHRDDMPALMSELDVVVHASVRPEPFGTVIAEAMSMERAVIATRAGGPPEYVCDGHNGLLVAPRDAEQMAAAILRLLNDGSLRQRLGAQGRQTVVQRFSIEHYVDKTSCLLDEVIESHRLTSVKRKR